MELNYPEEHNACHGFVYDKEQNIKIEPWQEKGPNKYNYLQLYIPPDRNSIAIEPMTCNIDAFNNHNGLITLQPKESFDAKYGVRVHT